MKQLQVRIEIFAVCKKLNLFSAWDWCNVTQILVAWGKNKSLCWCGFIIQKRRKVMEWWNLGSLWDPRCSPCCPSGCCAVPECLPGEQHLCGRALEPLPKNPWAKILRDWVEEPEQRGADEMAATSSGSQEIFYLWWVWAWKYNSWW